ncbi:hypothetical protein [Hoeflea sp.]|uniref:hypothetical protein n=1 Tax=Hoeflea sp. TaxID=1940281 RepID=UPI003A94217F
MKTLISAALLTVFAGTSAAFAIQPIPGSIDTGYTDKAPAGSVVNHRFYDQFGNDQAETYQVKADGSLELISRDQLEN